VAFYSDELIDDIKNSNDIVEVIGSYVSLKKHGRNFMGLCPFHREKTPSFVVSPEKQIFHCFGCSTGGSVINFISKIENIDFKETIEFLADRAGIILPTDTYKQDNKKQMLKNRIYEINKLAAIFYHQNLYKPESKVAQEYIKKRKLDNNILKSFLIGYSKDYDALYRYLASKGFTEEEILASNLVNKNNNDQFIDRFRKRLIFPILDTRDRVIAFGGRVLDDSLPKYINSPEGIVYSKGKNLYGFNIAKKSNKNKIIIVEGYMDAISLHQRGINNVVASLGTALTEGQGRLLRRYTEDVIISYDSDGAGQAATLRGLDILNSLGCNVKVLQMTGAKDPDEYIIKFGSGRFEKLIDEAISLVEFKVKILKQQHNLSIDSDRIKFLTQIAEILSRVDNRIEQEIYIDNIAKENNISKEAIYAQINKIRYNANLNSKILERPKVVVNKLESKEVDSNEKNSKREKLILYLLLEHSNIAFNDIKTNISIDDFDIDIHKKIAKKLYEILEKNIVSKNNIIDSFEETETVNYISMILTEDYKITDVKKALFDVINISKKEKMLKRKNYIINKLEDSTNITTQEKEELEKELNEIIIKLKK